MMDQGWVSLVLLPWPDPDKTVTLYNRVGLVARKTPYALPRHCYSLTVTAHHQAVVSADQVAILDIPKRKRGAAMRAKILDGGNAPFMASIENDFLTAYLPPKGLACDLVGGAGDIPGVFRIHEHLRGRLVFMDPFDRFFPIKVNKKLIGLRSMDPLRKKFLTTFNAP
jgi:hypothetical protein